MEHSNVILDQNARQEFVIMRVFDARVRWCQGMGWGGTSGAVVGTKGFMLRVTQGNAIAEEAKSFKEGHE